MKRAVAGNHHEELSRLVTTPAGVVEGEGDGEGHGEVDLDFAFRTAAQYGDDEGIRIVALQAHRTEAQLDFEAAYHAAKTPTATHGEGGHTFAALYVKHLQAHWHGEPAAVQRELADLRFGKPDVSMPHWVGAESAGFETVWRLIQTNDAAGLAAWCTHELPFLVCKDQGLPPRPGGKAPWERLHDSAAHHKCQMQKIVLDRALQVAAIVGDDGGIQVLAQQGGLPSEAAAAAARTLDPNEAGVGGHHLAATYVDALRHGRVSPYTSLDRLVLVAEHAPAAELRE